MKRVVGGVEVQDQAARGFLRRSKNRVHEELLQVRSLCNDLLVPRPLAQESPCGLQAVQRALARQRLATVASSPTAGPLQITLAAEQRQQRVGSKLVVVVEVFVAKAQAIDSLSQQRLQVMLDEPLVSQIEEALREPLNELLTALNFT